jgi:serine/threonine protein kinase
MAAPSSVDELLDLIRKSGVMEEKRLDAYIQQLRSSGMPNEVSKLAGLMVRDGLLTHFQAEQFLLGKWRRFTIGKYKVLERLGSGGMGSVYLCEHKFMRRRVAVKVLPAAKAEDPSSLERFYREARAAAALDHPNIVRAYDIDQDENLHFLVMEYVDGSSLQEIVKKFGPMNLLRACHYIRQAAVGLQHAHEAGLVHRDIKPGNLLVDRNGTVKVLDMGLARFFHDEEDILTKKYDESVLGTADYLAPEQALDSHSVDIRADIYSLGATFYFVLTGSPPFNEGTVAQKLIWHQTRQPKPIRTLRAEVPEGLVAVIDKMMHKDVNQRYQTPAAVVEALAPWTVKPIPPPPEAEMPRLSPAAMGTTGPEASAAAAQAPALVPGQPLPAPRKSVSAPASPAPRSPMPAPAAAQARPAVPQPAAARAAAAVKPAPAPAARPPNGGNGILPASAATAAQAQEAAPWASLTTDPDDKARISTPRPSGSSVRKASTGASLLAMLPTDKKKRLYLLGGVAGAFLLLLLLIIWLLSRGSKLPKTTPVAPTGSRLTVGQSGAYKTIAAAFAKAKNYDVIVLQDAEHVEYLSLTDSKTRDVTIEPESGKTVSWKPPAGAKRLLELRNIEGLRVKGITLDGGGQAEHAVTLAFNCPDVKLEDLTLQGFTQSAVLFANCAGETNRPVLLQRVRAATSREVEAALIFNAAANMSPPRNRAIRVKDSRFEGPYKATVQINSLERNTAPEVAVDVDFTANRFFNAGIAFRFNDRKAVPSPQVNMTIDGNTFCDIKQAALWFGRMPTGKVIVKNNLFTQTANLAQVDGNPDGTLTSVFPTPVGNVRSPDSKESNISLSAKEIKFDALPREPGNDKTFLRYPKDSPLTKEGEGGKPVGAGPQE